MRIVVWIGMISMCLIACTQPQKKSTQGTTFYYFPKANVYYDLEQKEYYVLDSVAGNWQQKKQLPVEEQSHLGKKIVIENPSVPVYKDNNQHRMIYGIVLYSSPEEMRQKFIEDSLKSLPKKIPKRIRREEESENEHQEKPKSKLRKFLDKIFG